MKKRFIMQIVAIATAFALAGCGQNIEQTTESNSVAESTEVTEVKEDNASIGLEDGSYMVEFDTDSTMFHVNETMAGKALLTVSDGNATLHLVMPSQNVLNLYKGLAEDAANNEAAWIDPTVESVTYEDGTEEEVYAFDVPVEVLGEEFDLALIGKKQVWYDHKVSISNPVPVEAGSDAETSTEGAEISGAEDKTIEVSLEGGTGKVKLISPTAIKAEAGGYLVTIEWSSKHYDYMIVDGEKYLPTEVNEHSIFEIPVSDINEPLNIVADTVAMSTPHEIEYVITFAADTMK